MIVFLHIYSSIKSSDAFSSNSKHLLFKHWLGGGKKSRFIFIPDAEVIAAGHANAAHLTVGNSGMGAKSMSAFFYFLFFFLLPFGDNIN